MKTSINHRGSSSLVSYLVIYFVGVITVFISFYFCIQIFDGCSVIHPQKLVEKRMAALPVEQQTQTTAKLPSQLAGEDLWIDHPDAVDVLESLDIEPWLKKCTLEVIRDGYTVVKGGIPDEVIDAAVAAVNRWCQNNTACTHQVEQQGFPARLNAIHTDVKEVADIFMRNKKALKLQDFILGSKTQLYRSLYFTKGSEQPVHVDIPFFWTQPRNRFLPHWTALEAVDSENGPLQVLPGGHRCHVLESRMSYPWVQEWLKEPIQYEKLFYAFGNASIANCAKQGVETWKEVHVDKGDVVLWHPLLPHGGTKIKDHARTRLSTVFHNLPEMMPVGSFEDFFGNRGPMKLPDHFPLPVAVVPSMTGSSDWRLICQHASGVSFVDSYGKHETAESKEALEGIPIDQYH